MLEFPVGGGAGGWLEEVLEWWWKLAAEKGTDPKLIWWEAWWWLEAPKIEILWGKISGVEGNPEDVDEEGKEGKVGAKEVEVVLELVLTNGAGGGGGTVGNKAVILSVGGKPGTLISGKIVLRLKLL